VAVAGRAYDQGGHPSTSLVVLNGQGELGRVEAGTEAPSVAANGGVFLYCSSDQDGSFGVGRAAYHQWCRPVGVDAQLGTRVELGYRSNFLDTFALPYAGGFLVELPGGVQSAMGLTDAWQNLAVLGLDGSLKQQFDLKLPSPNGSIYEAAPVVVGDCLSVLHWFVSGYNVPNSERSVVQRFCQSACP
jgi:hypothetical protein